MGLSLSSQVYACIYNKSLAVLYAGRELDLRKFHEAVEDCGGFDAVVNNKKFARIAVRLGINLTVATNAAYLLK